MTAGRRRLISLLIGVVLAGALAAVFSVGLHPAAPAAPAAIVNAPTAQGISAQTAYLMNLSVNLASQSRPAPGFRLVDQHGRPTSLAKFRGKVVIWSLNDDECVDLCTLFAQDVVAADRDLGRAAHDVVFLSVNANPFYPSPSAARAWSTRNDVEDLANWVFATGSPRQLAATWNAYHAWVQLDTKARTVNHDALIEFIDPEGRARAIGEFDDGSIDTAYYAHAMAQMAVDLLPASERVKVGGPDVGASSTAGATIGSAAPTIVLPRLAGSPPKAIAAPGKPLVVNFWSSTCSVCVAEMPALEQAYLGFKGKVAFVGVDVADPRAAAIAFARRAGVTYPLVADDAGSVAADYRVDELPVTFVVSPTGTIVVRHPGPLTTEQLRYVLLLEYPGLPQ